ncbi:MAG: nicotinate phosphoribosyltransferase [Kiloniellaceae bacterium]
MGDGGGLLLTDLYQLNMMQAYEEAGMTETAVFELFVRKLPAGRNFLVAAGLAQVVAFLETGAFTSGEIDWLAAEQRFSAAFLDRLRRFRFTGDLDAVAEGEIVFPDEPLLRVTAPLPEAQLLETRIINLAHFETVIASKAARMRLAAGDKRLIDFGLRRAHGAEAGLLAARASYLAGFDGTATVEAGRRFGIPVSGTMAHSFIQAHDDEAEAFRHFAHARPDSVILLLDTYDTEAAAQKVVALAPELAAAGIALRGVRLDSGDLGAHAVKVRAILDAGGLRSVQIFASGGLDEHAVARLCADGAPIDGFGIGTALTTAQDAPALDCAYKLQEYAGRARRKLSEGKATWPGRKQVFRRFDGAGRPCGDLLTLVDDRQDGTPLLQPVMRGGRCIAALPGLAESRAAALARLAALPPALAGLAPAPPYPVTVSEALKALARAITPV